jgi:hypothetical protein
MIMIRIILSSYLRNIRMGQSAGDVLCAQVRELPGELS